MKPIVKFIKWWWGMDGYGDLTVATFLFLVLDVLDRFILFPLYLALWLTVRKFNDDRRKVVERSSRSLKTE